MKLQSDTDSMRERARELADQAAQACREQRALVCQPPPPAAAEPYGDLVWLALVLRALNALPGAASAAEEVRSSLLASRQGRLWAFHRDTLVTATDSAIVMLGCADLDGARALDAFRTPGGGVLPQHWAVDVERGQMPLREDNRHWCQADFGTTCAVAAVQNEQGIANPVDRQWLEQRFEQRGGLYFANPYLLDWMLALALAGAVEHPLRARLAAELVASANDDASFGTYDRAFSTALAVLALRSLDLGRAASRCAQGWLADQASGPQPCTPFYSSLIEPSERHSAERLMTLGLVGPREQRALIDGQLHAISLYSEPSGVLCEAFVLMALSPDGPVNQAGAAGGLDVEESLPEPHARYRHGDPVGYAAGAALPPYAGNDPASESGGNSPG